MAHTVIWDRSWDFRPIGPSPPVSLVRDIPREKDVDILQLGCSDPRNIFWTLECIRDECKIFSRKLDITCCDSEPAILARNIIMFTLTQREDIGKDIASTWNIFFHLFLDTPSLELLLSQCQRLADSSESFETWHASQFSKYIKIGTVCTLRELHRHWSWYARTETFSDTHQARLKSEFQDYMKKHQKYYRGFVSTAAARAIGPDWAHAALVMNEVYHHYWETGVCFIDQAEIDAATHVNPIFAYSNHNEQFAMNDFTSPLATLLLGELFLPVVKTDPQRLANPGPVHCFEYARLKFIKGLGYFRDAVSAGNRVVMRFVFSDPLAFGLTAQEYLQSGRTSAACRVAPWRAPFLVFDGDGFSPSSYPQAPASFDVIDTCNTCDKFGILNVLLASAPLLKPHHWSVLYTETVEAHGDDPTKDFWMQLCGDLGAMTMLFDLAPTSFLSGFRTEGNTQELLIRQFMPNNTWFTERLTWRRPSRLGTSPSDQTLVIDREQFRDLLYGVYVRMFQREAFSYTTDTAGADKERSRAHYCRRTYALLLRYLSTRVDVEWQRLIMDLALRMQEPELMIGKISLHDYAGQLYQLGLASSDIFLPRNGLSLPWKLREHGRCRNWGVIPPTVYIAVQVPRKTFRILDKKDTPRDPPIAAGVGTTVGSESYHFVFVETCFGTLSVEGTNEHAKGYIREDPAGRGGDSPVVLTLCIPTHLLARPSPMEMHIRLLVLKTPHTDYFYEKYANVGRFFDISTTDPRVHILAQKPTVRRDAHIEEQIHPPIKWAKKTSDSVQITLDSKSQQVQTMTIRAGIQELRAKAALSDKATPIAFEQVDFRIIRLNIGSQFHQDVVFPYPLNGTKTRLRISRKECWIEVIVPPQQFNSTNRFPIIAEQGATGVWNMHRVSFTALPAIPVMKVKHFLTNWVNRHANYAFTEKELQVRGKSSGVDPLTLVKNTITSTFKAYLGVPGAPSKTVITVSLSDGSMEFILFLSSLKLDLAVQTVVFDAYVFPCQGELATSFSTALASLKSDTSRVVITKEEAAMWKYLIPALAERCRDWKHRDDCDFAQRTRLQIDEPLLCDCGKGKLETSSLTAKQRNWAHFLPHLTRIALSPLFGVSYLEPMAMWKGNDLEKMLDEHGLTVSLLHLLSVEGGRWDHDHEDTYCQTCMYWLPPGSRKACEACKEVVYCGKMCQTFGWIKHKRQCKEAQRRK